jgi:hypothetical protein
VLVVAYAVVLSLGTLVFEELSLADRVPDKPYSLFQNGLRLWDVCLGNVHKTLLIFTQSLLD